MLMLISMIKDQENRKGQFVVKELKSSISLWFERWFLSTNAKDIATLNLMFFNLRVIRYCVLSTNKYEIKWSGSTIYRKQSVI